MHNVLLGSTKLSKLYHLIQTFVALTEGASSLHKRKERGLQLLSVWNLMETDSELDGCDKTRLTFMA